ncbi:DNA-binding protein [Escherichia coli]|nr:DNA-binding protein [Escherichia coli]
MNCPYRRGLNFHYIRQTGFNPFDRDEGPSVKATQIGFGQLSRAQQVLGIGYLYVEAQLRQI